MLLRLPLPIFELRLKLLLLLMLMLIVAAPATTPTPAPAPERPHHHANPKRNRQSRGVVSRRRIINGRGGMTGGPYTTTGSYEGTYTTCGLACVDHITLLLSMTLVSTFCCSVGIQIAGVLCFLRMRCTASITSLCCAKKALPRSVGPLNVVC